MTSSSNNGIEALDLGNVESKKILSLLECPVCYDYITPPIKQCIKGHLVCSSCYQKLTNCPTCREELSTERNLILEKLTPFLKYPCRYHTFGCKEVVALGKKELHERLCPFVVVNCPFHAKCPWAGALHDMEHHIKMKHKIKPEVVRKDGIFFFKAKQFNKRPMWIYVFKWDGYLFKLTTKHVNGQQLFRRCPDCKKKGFLIAHIQLIGNESLAAKYGYTLNIFNANSATRSQDFEAIVTSHRITAIEETIDSENAVCVTYKDANVFTDEKGNLGFIINMKKNVHTSDEPEEESEDEEVEDEVDPPRKRLRRARAQNSSTEGTSTS